MIAARLRTFGRKSDENMGSQKSGYHDQKICTTILKLSPSSIVRSHNARNPGSVATRPQLFDLASQVPRPFLNPDASTVGLPARDRATVDPDRP